MDSSLSMADFLAATDSNQKIRVEADLGFGFVRLRSEEAERRQAIHDIRSSEDIVIELLRNARDAGATHIYLATYKEGSMRHITIIDDGDGIPESMHQEIFKPRVTSKLDTMALDKWGVHGRGMALYSITVNAHEAKVFYSQPTIGTSLSVITNTDNLTEKRDQSTYPSFELSDSGAISVRGPKNIIRTTCEFAFDTPSIQVYLGSPTEIAATLYQQGRENTNITERVFSQEIDTLSIPQKIAFSQTPADFQDQAAVLNLCMSERSARRIMDGEISSIPTILEQLSSMLTEASPKTEQEKPETEKAPEAPRGRLTSFSAEDIDNFKEEVAKAYQPLAEAYYLDPTQQLTIRFSKGVLHIAIPVEKQR